MNFTTFAQFSRRSRRLVWGGALTGLLLAAGATAIGDVHPDAKRLADQRRDSFSLFSGPTAVLQGNQLQCGLTNDGNGTCTDVFNSPTGGGGFWPTGSPNQYIFNTGVQVAGIMGPDAGPWAADTVGAFFFDARATNASGTAVTEIFDSLNPDDVANWPAEGFVLDTDIFDPVLIGRKTASQQDSWMQYWDGNPAKISGRQHPMGITVTSRSLAWNFPVGNESLIYFLFTLENSTASSEFQRLNEALFFAGNDVLPNVGITLNEVYAAFSTDMDVTDDAGENFSTVILPFDLGLSYHGGFDAPTFEYSPDIFFPPFFTQAPGLIGVKYLKSPIDPSTGVEVGLTLFSVTLNSATGFPDPDSDRQLWRYLSGKVEPSAGDFPCTVTPEVDSSDPGLVQRSICFLSQAAADTRFYQASGPFQMLPGAEATVVVAYIAAATVETMPDGTPSGIIGNAASSNANPPGTASFHPGFPSARGCTDISASSCTEVDNVNPVKILERGSGWFTYTGPPPATALESPAQKIDQFQVEVVPGSLLGKAIVAQTIFNNKFLLGFAPDQPLFSLVPGNNNVTVIWEKSASEDQNGDGDPFFQVASDPGSALFNPNYRQFDTEGYRVWRGTNAGNLTLIAQFDYADTEYTDFTCETASSTEDISNPLGPGFAAGETCPVGYSKISGINNDLVFNNGGAGRAPGTGAVRLSDGSSLLVSPTVAVVDDDAGSRVPLTDGGVPFVFTDRAVTNNFSYFYAVSAFDVNSPASGPHSLRSARVTKVIVPRADAPNIVNATLITSAFGDDGETLNLNGLIPAINGEKGTFSGPFPPANGLALSFAPSVPRLLPTFSRGATIDSMVPFHNADGECPQGFNGVGEVCWIMYLTVDVDGVLSPVEFPGWSPSWSAFDEVFTKFNLVEAEVAFDQDALDAFGIPSGAGFAVATATFDESIVYSNWEGQATRRGIRTRILHGGSRWFSGANETVADPAAYVSVGQLDGVTEVFAPIHHTALGPGLGTMPASGAAQCYGYAYSFLGRAADVQLTWNGGTVTARDLTHHVDVLFKPTVQAAYGFLNADTGDGNGNGFLDWADFHSITNVSLNFDNGGPMGFCSHVDNPATRVSLESTARLGPVQTDHTAPANGGSATGMGFGLLINGERFIFELDAIPADGTVWTLRTYSGFVRVSAASVDTDDPSGYSYRTTHTGDVTDVNTGLRPPTIPGLSMAFRVDEATNLSGTVDLTKVHTVPDPYLGTSLYDLAPTSKQLMFVGLPEEATIRIYSLTGVLVDVVVHKDITGGGRAVWGIRNRNQQFVASGVYFFHVVTPEGAEHVGKFTIINQAGAN